MTSSAGTIERRVLRRVENNLPFVDDPGLAQAVHWTPAKNLPVHRWFRYREGFSPYLLESFPNATHRLDPFCGCGTTLLESARKGIHAYGIDLNPLAVYVAKVKTRQYTRQDKDQFAGLYQTAFRTFSDFPATGKPAYGLIDKLFRPESLDTLSRLKFFIDSLPAGKAKDLLFLAWLSILEDASSVYKEGNGLKYRNKLRRPGRYITLPDRVWIPRYFGRDIPGFVLNLWRRKCEEIVEDMGLSRLTRGYTPTIRTGSCLDEQTLDFDRKFDFVIFSPPYANRFDYFEAFKVEMWMGGFVENSTDMKSLRSRSIRNNLTAERFGSEDEWPLLCPFLEAMEPGASSVRMGIKKALQGYFYDMRLLMRNLRSQLTRRAKVVIVVGNSAYAKSIIPTDTLVARLAQEENYHVDAIRIARHLHVSSQQRSSLHHLQDFMRESVIILEKA